MEEVPYCVILRGGPDAGKKKYFKAPRDRVDYMFNGCAFTVDGKVSIEMSYIAGNRRGKSADMVYVNKNLGSFVLDAQNKRTANRDMRYWKIPVPFCRRLK